MRKVPCPQCGKVTEYKPENPYRPFCSERCKIIDLGDWAGEKFKIPTQDQGDRSKISHSDPGQSDDDNQPQED
jgi:uncharacterized protein